MKPKLSIIIVTYNSAGHIRRCLESVERQTRAQHEIVIVDNCSSDNTVRKIKESKVPVKLHLQNSNLGFSKANNIGVGSCSGEYLLFLNPDTVVCDHAADKLISYMTDNQDAGIVAPKLVEDNGQPQPSVRKLPTIMGAFGEYYLGIKNAYQAYVPEGKEAAAVESVVGAAMLIPKAIYQKAGGFNNKYFMYFEDLELCKKVWKMGYKVIYQPQAVVRHSVGMSAATNPKTAGYLKQSATFYHGWAQWQMLYWLLKLRRIFRVAD